MTKWIPLAALLLGGCASMAGPGSHHWREDARYTTLDPALTSEFGFNPDYVKIVRFNLQTTATTATSRETPPRDAGAAVSPASRRSPSGAKSSLTTPAPAAPRRAAVQQEASEDTWLFQLDPSRYVIQLFSSNDGAAALHELRKRKLAGHVFYSPSGWWFALYDETWPTPADARSFRQVLGQDVVIRQVNEVRHWRCAGRHRQSADIAANLDQLCHG